MVRSGADAAMKPWLSRLRVRLLLLALLGLVPAGGLIVYTSAQERARASVEAREEARRRVRLVARVEERLIDGTRDMLLVMAQLPTAREADRLACQGLAARLVQQDPRYANLGVVDPNGRWRCAALPETAQPPPARSDWFLRAVAGRGFAAGDYDPASDAGGRPVLGFGYPTYAADGTLLGVAHAALDLAHVNELLVEAPLPAGATLAVADRRGVVLGWYPEPGRWVGRPLPDGPPLAAIRAEELETVSESDGADGHRYLYAMTRVDSGPDHPALYVTVRVPLHVALATVDESRRRGLVALGLVAAGILIAGLVGGELLLARPIRALVAATRRLGAGALETRTGLPHRSGELGELSRAFDEMAESLERLTRQHQRILESAGEGIYHVDLAGRVTFVNPAAALLLGRSSEELVGQSVASAPLHEPAHPGAFRWEGSPLQTTLSAGLRREGRDDVCRRPDGTHLPIEYVSTPIQIRGAVTGAVVVFRDISERQAAEETVAAFQRIGDRLYATLDIDALLDAVAVEARTLVGARQARVELRTSAGEVVRTDRAPEANAPPPAASPALVVPLLDGHRSVTGLIQVHDKTGGFAACDEERLIGLSRIAAIAIDNALNYRKVTEAEQAVKQSHETLRRLSEHLQEAREQERARVAREVHDELGQALTGLKVDIAWLARALGHSDRNGDHAVAEKLASMDGLVDATILATRRLVSELRPPALDYLGLVAAIEWQAEEFQRRTGIRCRVECEQEDLGLDPQQSASVFRIVQEALTNVSRHARATRVTVTAEAQPGSLCVCIQDNGRGISPGPPSGRRSFGLLSMRERAHLLGGELEVSGVAGEGTTVTLRVPRPPESVS
jgi:PAS domain S-box-containing protein